MPSFDESRPWQQLYNARWRRERLRHLAKHPLCVHCLELGKVAAATVVDHVTPHKGNLLLFWDPKNRQSLCAPCHDGWKQRLEIAPKACGAEGYPTTGEW